MVNRKIDALFGAVDISVVAQVLARKKLVMLGGAGISRDSGLPVANELTDEVLRCLGMSGKSRDEMNRAQMPFELFIETLAACSEVAPLYEIYQQGSPCLFHHLCCKLWNSGALSAVVTTNFDALFEDAFDAEGIAYDRFWKEDDLQVWAPTNGLLPLIKLHGSAHDEPSLGSTIKRVANQRGVRAREVALRTAFLSGGAELIVVAGYSGSDRFDINPALLRIASSAPPVALIQHISENGRNAVLEPLADHPKAGPFAAFQGIRIECDTSMLLLEMMSHNSLANALSTPDREWHEHVLRWVTHALTKHGEAFRPYACGALLKAAARPKDAQQWFVEALSLPSSPWMRIELFLSLARCERDVGENLPRAQQSASKALRLARKAKLIELETKALTELGVIAADLMQYPRALKHYKQAENLARATSEIEKVGVCIGNAGIVRKNMGGRRRWLRALRDYTHSIDIARDSGDKRSEGRTIGNLGILHSVMGNPRLAIKHFKAAAEIARELGDAYHEAIWLVCEADDVFAVEPATAISLVTQARHMFMPLSVARVKECDAHLTRFSTALTPRVEKIEFS